MKRFYLIIASLVVAANFSVFGQEPFKVDVVVKARVIPIALSGYTGEAASVLKFDFEVAGFEITTADKAEYVLSGKNDGNQVEGRLVDNRNKASLLAKAYTGETTRAQAHSLADEAIQKILNMPWIARGKVVFKEEVRPGQSEILIADYDGHNAKPVTQDNTIVAAPVWVPKQWHLLYTSYRSGFPWIYSHNLTSGERRPFAKFAGLNTSAAISPDGTKVAMVLSKAGSPDIWVSDINGGGLKRLTETKEDESSPCWSPDGTQICYASRTADPNVSRRSLYVIPAAGGPAKRLQTAGIANPSEPDWSPDGKTIVFTSEMGGFNICTIPAQGGTAQLLVAGEDPAWASNSRTVIFTRRSGNKRVLSLLDVPTKRVKDTAQISGSRSQPNWAK